MEILGISTPILAGAGIAGAALATTAMVFGIRKLIRVGQFSYHNSRLSTAGNPYVRKDEVLPLIGTSNPLSLAKTINSDISPGESTRTFRDVDRSLMLSFHKIMTDLLEQTPGSAKPLVRSFISHLEGEELKRLLRLVGHRKEPLFPIGWLNRDLEANILASKDIRSAMEVLEGQPVTSRISQHARTSDELDLSLIDSSIDMYVMDILGSMDGLSWGSRGGAKTFFDIHCDRYNIHLIFRAKKASLDRDAIMSMLYSRGGLIGMPILEQLVDSSGIKEAIHSLSGTHMEDFLKEADPDNMTDLETSLDRMMLQGSIGLSHAYGSSVGPTIRFMVSKELEVRNLRILFQSAFSGWDSERTRKMLVLEEGL